MKALFILLLVPLALTSCLKDDLDPEALTTNPFDLDYNGTPLLVLELDTVEVITDQFGNSIDTVLSQTVRVRTELLSPLAGWSWRVKDLTTNVVSNSTSNSATFTAYAHSVTIGTTRCFEYTLIAELSPTLPYTFCSEVEL
ncbi:MAG: hypothetical protein ACOH13_09235 [Flavobacteriales bacterium]